MKMLDAQIGAKKIIENCASIKEGENVLVVSDFETLESSQILVNMAYILGADVETSSMIPRELDGQEPTKCVEAAMGKAEVILMSVSKSLAHTNAAKNALGNGARILSLTANSIDLMASSAYKANFKKQRPFCRKVADSFSEANEVKIVTPAGTAGCGQPCRAAWKSTWGWSIS